MNSYQKNLLLSESEISFKRFVLKRFINYLIENWFVCICLFGGIISVLLGFKHGGSIEWILYGLLVYVLLLIFILIISIPIFALFKSIKKLKEDYNKGIKK